ncbi:MAG: glycosyltransferase family 4 protein [Anaerolineae bacterium]|nr:glycosyltransferase family 4 protein [Anaerolineae bacterium]
MNILMFSITPLFPDQVMGGAQKHLQSVAEYLGELGHEVVILCTWREDTPAAFNWHPRVRVEPLLRFKQPFPGPYEAPAYHIAAIIQDLGERLAWADRFYMHDGEMIFPYVYRETPTVISLRDCIYPETWQGAFHFQGDALILVSAYQRDFFAGTVGRFFPAAKERVHLIDNGIDWEHFKPTPPDRIRDYVDVDPARDAIVLHPHRPELNKGMQQTIDVLDRLVHGYGLSHVKALVPQWIGTDLSPALRAYYDDITRQIEARGLREHVVLHGWIPQALMPEYLSLGTVMLALGSIVEAFGNVVYESLGCGTPAIAARTSVHRELLPDDLLDKVDFDDADTAAAIAAEIITSGRRTSPQTLAALHARFSRPRMVAAYADVILNARKLPPLPYEFHPLDAATRYRLAPWCYPARRGIYHDFRADYRDLPGLLALDEAHPDGFTQAEAAVQGVPGATVQAWYREGYLVPVRA